MQMHALTHKGEEKIFDDETLILVGMNYMHRNNSILWWTDVLSIYLPLYLCQIQLVEDGSSATSPDTPEAVTAKFLPKQKGELDNKAFIP